MGYIANNLIANEHILYHSRFHWWAWGKPFFYVTLPLLLAGALLGLVNPVWAGAGMAGAVVIGILFCSPAYLRWRFAELGVTNRRVIIKRGIVVRKIIEVNFNQIENSTLSETFWGRILGYQKILISHLDNNETRLNLVRDGQEFHERVLEQLNLGRTLRENYVYGATPPATPKPTKAQNNATAAQLEALQRQNQLLEQQLREAQRPQPVAPPPKPVTPPKQPTITPSVQSLVPMQAGANPAAQLRQAMQLIQQNKRQEALQLLKQLLEQDQNNADAWYLMGTIIVEPNRKRSMFIKALRANPNHPAARQALANWR